MKPNWLYKKVDFKSLLPIFQKEFLELVYDIDPKLPSRDNYLVSSTDPDHIKKFCPYFYRYLKALKIEQWLNRVGFVIVSKPKKLIHSDFPAASYALNIPVLNCQNTYTVWYQSAITNKTATDYNSPSWQEVGLSPLYENDGAIEIGRIHCLEPHWVNVEVPHTPECHHSNLRINCTVRFTDEIYQYFSKFK